MSAQHTPGPWEAEPNGSIKGSNGEWSALSLGNSYGTTDANARLIAAAPEMLSSLEWMVFWLQGALTCETWGWDGDQRKAAEFTLVEAKAIIAKAKGGAA